ncbi:TPA: AAA family ATPase [Providencia rettgeri]|nr:AAA family ATPase [Providencia rettgeri]ELR5196489.1 AAA family ATPase [Providencia rettgeri]HEM8140783.1 AAA family ATPase [Providencia rettgeri]
MKISFERLGFIKTGAVDTNDITIIFGPNNVGKTYLSYSIFSTLLEYRKSFTSIAIVDDDLIENLVNYKNIEKCYNEFFKIPNQNELCRSISNNLPKFFKDTTGMLSNASIEVKDEADIFDINNVSFSWILNVSERVSLKASKVKNDDRIKLELLEVNSEENNEQDDNSYIDELKNNVRFLLNFIGRRNIFKSVNKRPFIITSERTGISVFLKEIDRNRNDVLNKMQIEAIGKESNGEISSLLNERVSNFAEPINNNINIIRDSINGYAHTDENDEKNKDKEYSSVLNALNELIGGEYRIKKDEIIYLPKNEKEEIQLPMSLASGAGKSLFLFDLYVNRLIEKDSYLIIDEPELNLHPLSQIKMAKFLVRLANYGVKIIITTHSDFIIKEMNNRIMANQLDNDLINEELGYDKSDVIDKSRVSAFTISSSGTIENIEVGEYGVSSELFDMAIVEVEERSDKLIYALAGRV